MLKTQLCEEKGIHLIHVFEDELEFEREKVCCDIVKIIKGECFGDEDGDELVVSHAKFPLWLKADGYQFSHFIS